jgi:hypothetical protein
MRVTGIARATAVVAIFVVRFTARSFLGGRDAADATLRPRCVLVLEHPEFVDVVRW